MFERRKENAATANGQTPATSVTRVGARAGAVIGPSLTVKGEISGGEDLLVEGTVEGTISLSGQLLTVGESGRVVADLQAKVVKVEGQVTGDITALENAIITRTGRVLGDITAPRVTLEDGGVFKGRIDMQVTQERPESVAPPKRAVARKSPVVDGKKVQSGK
jgi:cytoskeletal protein CcmA (bactofilin family)